MIILLALSIVLFFTNNRKISLLIFVFFLTNGFQLVPFNLFSMGYGIKSSDYAFGYLLGVVLVKALLNNLSITKLNEPTLDRLLMFYFVYLILEILYSRFYLSIPVVDIFRSSRMFFLFLTPFLLSSIGESEYLSIKNILLRITLVQSILFTIQSFTGVPILNGYLGGGGVSFAFLEFYRFYNAPFLGVYFLFWVLLSNDYKTKRKILYSVILLLPNIFSFHRSNIAAVVFSVLAVSFFYKDSFTAKFKKIILIGLFAVPLGSVLITIMNDRGASSDIYSVINGDYLNVDFMEELEGNTFSFRIAHLYERTMHVAQNSVTCLFGSGFVHEDSFYVRQNFDFIIGLRDDVTHEIIQVDTSDISWSVLILRFGFVGTLLYFLFTMKVFLIGFKYRTSQLGGVVFGQMLVLFITSLTSTSYLSPLFYIFLLSDCKILMSEKECNYSHNKQIICTNH